MSHTHIYIPNIGTNLGVTYQSLNLQQRTDRALQRNQLGGTDPDLLAARSVHEMLALRGIGEETFKDLARKLMQQLLFPKWLPEIARDFRYREAEIFPEVISHTFADQGWDYLAEPYVADTFWQLERVLADLDKGKVTYRLVRESISSPIQVFCRELVLGPFPDQDEFDAVEKGEQYGHTAVPLATESEHSAQPALVIE